MDALRLRLFGPPSVEHAGASVALPFERRSQLLVLLALRRSWVPRAEIAAMLWPQHERKQAQTNLRKTLFRLQALPWGDQVESDGAALRLQAATDVADFEAAWRDRRGADALALGGGELLAGFDDGASEPWTVWLGFERDRLRAAWRTAALAQLDAGCEAADAIALSARLLEADPLDEAALRAQMAALAQAGQPAAARQAYRAFVQRLGDELGLAPAPQLQALHDALGTPAAPPVSRAAPPLIDDGFVGRVVELHRIAELLAGDECRLLAIVGPGGIGKTRLARRAMQELAPGFGDGAVFVPLEDAVSAADIGVRLAHEVGAAGPRGADPLDAAIARLRERQVLVVLDNVEQFAADAAPLQRLLQACGRLKLIVTSRVRLGLPGEWTLPLEGLPCPDAEDVDRIEAFDAARLFVKTARRVDPSFAPGAEAAALIDICRQLDGLPLALELAAAWVRVLPCAAIAGQLRRGTELLRATGAAHAARHASIELVFDQSWQRLSPVERDVLARLAVLRGGFTSEAARAVAQASLPVLGALADKSLLRRGDDRLHLHPLVQQLAAARLEATPAQASALKGHAEFFLHSLVRLRAAVECGERDALAWVDVEFENWRAAWRWAVARGDVDALASASRTVLDFCDHRGRVHECHALLNEACNAPQVAAVPAVQVLLTARLAHLEYRLDRYADAQATAARALAAGGAAMERRLRLQCLTVLGSCGLRLGHLADARRHFKQALRLIPASDVRLTASALDNLALAEKASGRYDEALRLSLEALLQYRRLGNVADLALCLNNLADLYLVRDDPGAALAHLNEALALCERHGIESTRLLVLCNLTEVALKTADDAAARRHAARARERAEAAGNRVLLATLEQYLVHIALRDGDAVAARAHLASSLGIAMTLGRPSLQLGGVAAFAEVLAAQGEIDSACRVLDFAAAQPGLGAPDRDAMRRRAAAWRPAATSAAAWPGLSLPELAQRIVIEAGLAHAPLIAALRGG